MPIPLSSTAIHGITDKMVKGKPTVGAMRERFLARVRSVDALVGYNFPFDSRMLSAGMGADEAGEGWGEAIAGKNYTGVQADIVVYFNSDVDGSVLGDRDWHYGADLPTGGDIDFQTVAMHELAHGLGIFSSFESDGSWGRGSKPYIFDTMLVNAAGERLIDLPVSGANVTSEVYFDGAAAAAAYQALGGSWLAPIYAPSTWREGSSLSHLDEATFTGANDFMTPLLNTPLRDINPVVLGMMQDLGWSVVPEPTSLSLLAIGAAMMIVRRRIVPQLS